MAEMAVGEEEKKPVLPVLNCYLTFIHYFGFSINPNDAGNSRYLSVRVKRRRRRRQLRRAGQASLNNNQNNSQQQMSCDDQWLASYKLRAQRTVCSMPPLLIRFLKISVKFTAIAFTTFIALNHCIVLADYIYQGSKVFLELMLEVRLVITKFSALIFVLSWHFSQTKVRQLIKLVKSTSIYIIGTQAIWLPPTSSESSPGKGSSEAGASREPMFSSSGWRCLDEQRQRERLISIRRRRAACRHLGTNEADCRYYEENVIENDRGQSERDNEAGEAATATATATAGKTMGEPTDEIGDTLLTNINYMDRRFLNWWLMCVCVTTLHFSLSEAELSKSHHLWQWLDDYSMHQLNNQTISQSTLLFLASFDNYIYTVHVYGTRLIGASIICIVCSLQRENIASLRWHALKLIQRCSPQSPVVARPNQLSSHRCSAFLVSARALAKLGSLNSKTTTTTRQQHNSKTSRTWFVGGGGGANGEADESSATDDCDCELSGGSWQSNSSTTSRIETKATKRYLSCNNKERDLFFVLGESDWLRVHECARNCRPSGYLSSALHWARRSFISQLSARADWLAGQRFCGRVKGICMNQVVPSNQIGVAVVSGRAENLQQNNTNNNNGDNNNNDGVNPSVNPMSLASSSPATPTLTPAPDASPMTSLDQIASSKVPTECGLSAGRDPSTVVVTDRRGGGHSNPQSWPTPNGTTTGGTVSNGERLATTMPEPDEGESQSHRCKVLAAAEAATAATAETINDNGRDHSVEWQLERLASKYELVRTVNARIDSCFGPMLLIQFSFLFLMSCIDVVYFSICFNPNTKTKYIIVSGMILLWWPYLLLYKFASDIGAESKELLISVRRLARLWLLEHHNCCLANDGSTMAPATSPPKPTHDDRCSPWRPPLFGRNYPSSDFGNMAKANCAGNNNNLTYCSHDRNDFSHYPWLLSMAGTTTTTTKTTHNRDKTLSLDDEWPLTKRFWPHYTSAYSLMRPNNVNKPTSGGGGGGESSRHGMKARACIINKLDHVFKPTYLSIMGIMTVDKFFLLNFAKIVITASVMIIQFIT